MKIFSLQIINPKTGVSYSPFEIHESLRAIVDKSSNQDGLGIGILTAENRDTWYDVYSKLTKSILFQFLIFNILFYNN